MTKIRENPRCKFCGSRQRTVDFNCVVKPRLKPNDSSDRMYKKYKRPHGRASFSYKRKYISYELIFICFMCRRNEANKSAKWYAYSRYKYLQNIDKYNKGGKYKYEITDTFWRNLGY